MDITLCNLSYNLDAHNYYILIPKLHICYSNRMMHEFLEASSPLLAGRLQFLTVICLRTRNHR